MSVCVSAALLHIQPTITNTSKVPALRTGYFATEMNACESLGAVRSTWYTVVIMCRGRHWSNCQCELAHVAETMKFMAGLKAFKWPSFTRCRHEAEHYTDELDS